MLDSCGSYDKTLSDVWDDRINHASDRREFTGAMENKDYVHAIRPGKHLSLILIMDTHISLPLRRPYYC